VDISLFRERSEIMKADGLLISAENFPGGSDFRLPITAK
jgi:hypothetical protein